MKYFKNVLLPFSEKDLFTPYTYVIIENMFSLVIQLIMLQLMQHSLSIDQQILRKQSRATLFFLLFLFNSDFAFSVVHRRTIWLVLD